MSNISSTTRNGVIGTCTYPDSTTAYDFAPIDNLTFSYTSGTNKVLNLAEASDKDHGFRGLGGTLGYDANGNMTNIGYKKMIATYNHLNLPTSFTHQVSGSEITIDYDAGGTKLRKTTNDQEEPDSSYVKDYLGGIEYKDGKLEFITFSEGRITRKDEEYFYEYFLKDHLGNTRIVFADKNKDGFLQPFNEDGGSIPQGPEGGNLLYTELLQESHYYSFGMEMEGPWDLSVSWPENGYLYNGKELNGDFGLDWLDYGARWYDPSIARWNAVDPLVEIYDEWSPYNYTLNNPISNIDPDGRSVVEGPMHIASTVVNDRGEIIDHKDDGDDNIYLNERSEANVIGRERKGQEYRKGDHLWAEDFHDSANLPGFFVINVPQEELQKNLSFWAADFFSGGFSFKWLKKLKELRKYKKWIKSNPGKKLPGTKKGSSNFKNREGKLPSKDANGNPITYKEYDVNPTAAGKSRDAERLVVGSNGKTYYTSDHYKTFKEIID